MAMTAEELRQVAYVAAWAEDFDREALWLDGYRKGLAHAKAERLSLVELGPCKAGDGAAVCTHNLDALDAIAEAAEKLP